MQGKEGLLTEPNVALQRKASALFDLTNMITLNSDKRSGAE